MRGAMKTANQKGVALIMTLILLAVLSAMAVSFMFLSQTETWSTMNYRLMSQARDGAEAGVNAAANYILGNTTPAYAPPDITGADLITQYTLTSYPVKYNGGAVILSASPNAFANYPYAPARDNYNITGVGKGTMTVGSLKVDYNTYATLLAMRNITTYGGGTATVQTWLITSDGVISNGVRLATVEVSAILERPIVPAYNYAAFASSNQCAALTFSQAGTLVKSYDSTVSPPPGGILASDGNVGTNGNLSIASNATIDGSLSTPAVGTGTCVNGAGGASTAETACTGCTVAGGVVELPQPISYITPSLPSPMPPITAESGNNNCGSGATVIPNCQDHITDPATIADKVIYLAPGNYGQLNVGSAMTEVHLRPGTYNMDSFAAGNVALIIDSTPVDAVTGTKVVLKVTGCATLNAGNTDCATYLGTAVDFSSSGITNPSYNPMNFQIEFAGGTACAATSPNSCPIINVKCGNTQNAATIFAPNANITLSANGTFYGAAIGNSVTVSSGGTIMYDRNLKDGGYTVGNWVLGGFTWAKF